VYKSDWIIEMHGATIKVNVIYILRKIYFYILLYI
jgi:hypothetical protein